MQDDALRTIDTVSGEIVLCPACSTGDALRIEETITGTQLVTCLNCGYSWEEHYTPASELGL